MLPLKITVRSISDSPVIHFYIKKRFAKLNRLFRKIHSCNVVIDTQQKHGLKGKVFSVHIDLAIPGRELVSKKSGFNLYIAIRDAFDTLENNLLKCRKRKIVRMQHYQMPYINKYSGGDDPILPEAG